MENVNRFAGRDAIVNRGPRLAPDVMDAVLDRCDVLYTIEGPYAPDLFERCCDAGVRLVIHANPELWRGWDCHTLLVPTTWLVPHLAEVVPFPVDVDRLQPSQRAHVPRFVHVLGPAMLDRQGTQLVLGALAYVRHECEVILRHDGDDHVEKWGNATLRWQARTRHYWQVIPDGCWALLQPRRYGGLSLPVQEAAARGLPTICLDREPEATFYGPVTVRCPVTETMSYPMAGGLFPVAECDPAALAVTVDAFIEADGCEADPRAWAEAHSWEALLPTYAGRLRR